jgi:hypothetical protein
MASIAIFLIVALGFTLGVLSTFSNNRTTKNITIAMNLAQAKMEEIRMKGSSALVGSNDTVDSAGNSGGTFTRQWTIVTNAYGGATGLYHLRVTVTWPGGGSNTVELSTLIGT